jgi:hypothetical protein
MNSPQATTKYRDWRLFAAYLLFVVVFFFLTLPKRNFLSNATSTPPKPIANVGEKKVHVQVRRIAAAAEAPTQQTASTPKAIHRPTQAKASSPPATAPKPAQPPPMQKQVARASSLPQAPSDKPSPPVGAGKSAQQGTPARGGGRSGEALALSADYRSTLGWPGYVSEMTRLGGVFYVFDGLHDKLKAEIDLQSGQFHEVDSNRLGRMSPRVREITGEVAVSQMLSKAHEQFGSGRYSVLLLLPRELDSRIEIEASSGLREQNVRPNEIVRLNGEYRSIGGHLELRVSEAIRKDGSIVPVRFVVRL